MTTGIGGLVSTVLSALGFGSQAASGPVAPPQPPLLWAMLGWVRRELGHIVSPLVSAAGAPVAALVAEDVSIAADSPLATPEQLAAEKLATQTANSLPVALMKLVLRQQFLDAANKLYPEGVDAENLAALDKAVNEYAMGAAFQQLLLNSMTPKFITQVAPPHIWFGQNVPGSRILYDNPDTIYRFTGVNGASEYEIRGQIHNWSNVRRTPGQHHLQRAGGPGRDDVDGLDGRRRLRNRRGRELRHHGEQGSRPAGRITCSSPPVRRSSRRATRWATGTTKPR